MHLHYHCSHSVTLSDHGKQLYPRIVFKKMTTGCHIEFCIQTNRLPQCYWNVALHFPCDKQPNNNCAVFCSLSLSLKNAQTNTLICYSLYRSARTLADEHWRVEADEKGGAQGDAEIMTEILEQT